MKKNLIVFVLVLLMISGQLMANTRFYRLSYRDDPSTTVVIGWSDNGTSSNAKVYYGTTDLGTNSVAYPYNHGIDTTTSYVSLTNHFARITGLTPNTKYYFVVKDDQGISARYSFKTITDDPNSTITFIAGGDSRTAFSFNIGETGTCTGGNCRLQRQNANKLVSKIRPDFVSFNGDFIMDIDPLQTTVWPDWFTDWQLAYGPDADGGLIVPFMAAMGNHEVNADIFNLFDITNSNDYYALSFGGNLFRFYSLNVSADNFNVCTDAAQLNWFTNDLNNYTGTSSEPVWKICQYHTPMAPHAETTPNQYMIDCWANLFQPKKVNLCIEGHSHVMKYTWPIVPSSAVGSDNGFIRDDVNGTVYIGEGAWGAPVRPLYTTYSATAAYNWTRDQASSDGFHVICVNKNKIQIRTVKFDVVATVGQVGPNDPECTLPANLSIWTPANGAVVEILNPSVSIIEQQSLVEKVSIFPVPAKDIITLNVKEKLTGATIDIYNGTGKLMKTETADITDSYQLNIKDLRAGTYFIFIKAAGYSESHKIIVE
jgi:acid phosphatase type 7